MEQNRSIVGASLCLAADAAMTSEENERQYRIIDQLLTAHAVLRDRYGRRARILSVFALGLAITLNGFVFASDDVLKFIFRGRVEAAKIGLGFTSIGLLVLAILEFRVNWEGKRQSHSEGVDRLSRLKAKYREAHTTSDQACWPRLSADYATTMQELPPVPERDFAALKARHEHKRLLSREISEHPGVPYLLLSLRLRWHAYRQLSAKTGLTNVHH
jgi:hypothetical protein